MESENRDIHFPGALAEAAYRGNRANRRGAARIGGAIGTPTFRPEPGHPPFRCRHESAVPTQAAQTGTLTFPAPLAEAAYRCVRANRDTHFSRIPLPKRHTGAPAQMQLSNAARVE